MSCDPSILGSSSSGGGEKIGILLLKLLQIIWIRRDKTIRIKRLPTSIAQNSSWSLPLFLYLLIIVLPSSAEGFCTIRDGNGKRIPMLTLPADQVDYHANTDTLSCLTAQSCRNYMISGCHAVYCRETQSCENAKLIQNHAIACWAHDACANSYIAQSHEVSCGAGYTNSCILSTIETTTELLCYGPDACDGSTAPPHGHKHVEDNDEMHKNMVFKVGGQGKVRCASGADGGISCKNLIVEVSHEGRACFGTGSGVSEDDKNCAVVCAEPGDCDHNTIQFRMI